MLTQTSVRLSQDLLAKELERAGAGFAQMVVDGIHQTNAGKDRPYLPISIRNISTQTFNFEDGTPAGTVCLTQNCSLLTIFSGEVQYALQITNIDSSTMNLTASGSIAEDTKLPIDQVRSYVMSPQMRPNFVGQIREEKTIALLESKAAHTEAPEAAHDHS